MFTKSFKNLSKSDVLIAGGKGASLGEMTKAKIPVPTGFVILVAAFNKFLAETDLGVEIKALLRKVDYKNIHSVNRVSNKIRDLIMDAEFPEEIAKEVFKGFSLLGVKYAAVRSSATAEDSSVASWAGELESYLNVTKETLLVKIKKCWASLFTPRAIFYRFEKKLRDAEVLVAVVVQTMIQSEISGICFTVHPITKDCNQMVIEAGYGLGEAIVGGRITPDTYIVNKQEWGIVDKNISQQKIMIVKNRNGNIEKAVLKLKQKKQKLSDLKIVRIAKLCQKIEEHYGQSQDIEWAFAKDKFFIVQSRPITTL